MFLSVIIPYYDCSDYVYMCLKSIAEGIDKVQYLNINVEVLVIDDFNVGRSFIELQKAVYTIDNPHIKVIRAPENLGLSDARNLGVSHACGQYIFFLDADDYINSQSFVKIVETLKHVETDILFFDSHTFSNEHTWRQMGQFSFHPRSVQQITDTLVADYLQDSIFYAWRFMVKADIMRQQKFVSRLYMEDIATTPVVLAHCQTLWYEPISMVNYRIRPNSIMSTYNPKKFVDMVLAPTISTGKLKQTYQNSEVIKQKSKVMGYRFFYWAIQDARVLNKNIDKEFYLQIKNLYIEHFGQLDLHKELPLLKQIYTEKHEIIKWLLLYYNWFLFKNTVTPKGNFRFKAFRKRIYHTMILVWRILVPTIIIVFIILNIYQLLK